MKARTVTVTLRALVQRINRHLKKDGEQLMKARERDKDRQGNYRQGGFGPWYIVDFNLKGVIDVDIEPEELGRELGVLRPWETLEGDEATQLHGKGE